MATGFVLVLQCTNSRSVLAIFKRCYNLLMFSIPATTYSTAVIVFIVICFVWAMFYSTRKIRSLYVGSLLKGILLVSIAICLYMIITGGVDPNLLVILGIAVVCFSIIPKPPQQ